MTLHLVICKVLHRTADMGACLSFEHITQQLPELIRDIFWVIKCLGETQLRREGLFVSQGNACTFSSQM
jgi:hypothetical protein